MYTAAKCGDTMIKLLVHFIYVGKRLYADYITSLIVHIIFSTSYNKLISHRCNTCKTLHKIYLEFN